MKTNNAKLNQQKILIAPSILSADFAYMGEAVIAMEKAGADWIHCDVMDGQFVPNITFGFKLVEDIRKLTRLPLDVHLMIVEPERYVDRFIGSGADIVTIHYEAANDPKTSLQQIRKRGVKAGISINPDTPVSVLNDLYEYCDLVLLMSVFPGFGGQSFIKESLERLKSLVYHAKHANPNILIEIDGGVTLENASLIKQAGVEILVAGNTIFSSPNYKKAIELLRKG